jgi:hypothetical protein
MTAAKKDEKAQFITILISGKKRLRHPVLVGGLNPDDFYL